MVAAPAQSYGLPGRVAVCLTGQMRSAACSQPDGGPSPLELLHKLVQTLGGGGHGRAGSVDVFAILDGANAAERRADLVRQLMPLQPVELVLEDQAYAEAEWRASFDRALCIHKTNFLQARRLAQCWRLLESREERLNFRYTHVARARPDVVLSSAVFDMLSRADSAQRAAPDLCWSGEMQSCWHHCSNDSLPTTPTVLAGAVHEGGAWQTGLHYSDHFYVVRRSAARPFFDHLTLVREQQAAPIATGLRERTSVHVPDVGPESLGGSERHRRECAPLVAHGRCDAQFPPDWLPRSRLDATTPWPLCGHECLLSHALAAHALAKTQRDKRSTPLRMRFFDSKDRLRISVLRRGGRRGIGCNGTEYSFAPGSPKRVRWRATQRQMARHGGPRAVTNGQLPPVQEAGMASPVATRTSVPDEERALPFWRQANISRWLVDGRPFAYRTGLAHPSWAVVCFIPKAGSSAWKALLVRALVLQGFAKLDDRSSPHDQRLPYWLSHDSNVAGAPTLIFVRHPISRLLSAYLGKGVTGKIKVPGWNGTDFRSFVHVVTSFTSANGRARLLDQHYQLQTKQCGLWRGQRYHHVLRIEVCLRLLRTRSRSVQARATRRAGALTPVAGHGTVVPQHHLRARTADRAGRSADSS